MYYVIHTGLEPHDDPTILGMYDDEADARAFIEDYVEMHLERDRLQIARVINHVGIIG